MNVVQQKTSCEMILSVLKEYLKGNEDGEEERRIIPVAKAYKAEEK